VSKYNQFWVETDTDDPEERVKFLTSFLPWLADAVQRDLKVARNRPQEQRYFEVLAGLRPDDHVDGLNNALPKDFSWLIRVQRLRPSWTFSRVAAIAQLPPGGGPGPLSVQAWLFANDRNPRYTKPLSDEPSETGDRGK